MNEFDTVQLVALVGWLILAVGALASYRLNWQSGIKLVLIWACIFTAVALFISVVQ
ncbi:hypothetical protein [Parerythrobacter jejuensis]|uniref:hypothetical protein n=1 Tax=Parerythrobacter jejuensis TaxID=795812 RepID=UPI0018F8C8F5|nr:hypothetical protein [Parerythrobacter jejuensis]